MSKDKEPVGWGKAKAVPTLHFTNCIIKIQYLCYIFRMEQIYE